MTRITKFWKGLKQTVSVFALVFGTMSALTAQGLPSEEVDVVKDFNARLIQTNKFDLQPELPQLDTLAPTLELQIQEIPLPVEYPAPQIRPLAAEREDNPDVYRGYARLGAGIPRTIFGEAHYSFYNQENFVMDFDLAHHSTDNSKEIENQKFSHSRVGLDGTYFSENGPAFRGRVGYKRQTLHYYGYNAVNAEREDTLSFASEDVRQRFTTLSVGGELFNGRENDLGLDYSLGADFYHLQDLYSARENGVDVRGKLAKYFPQGHLLNVGLRADFSSYRDTASQSLNNFFVNPSYTYHGGIVRVKAGVNIASHADDFFFFPDVRASLNIIPNIMTLFAGFEGDLRKNNLQTLSDYNPYIETRLDLRNTEYTNYYAGVRGQILGMDYAGRVAFKNAKDLALFQGNQDTIPRFDVVYDTVDIVSIQGEITFPLFEGFNLTGRVAQNIYSPKNEDKAWHLPGFELNVGASYVLLDQRLTLKGDLFVENGVPYRRPDGTSGNLNALFDISVAAEFMFTENVGAFARVNNLLDNERERWHRYPVLGINALAGLTARF